MSPPSFWCHVLVEVFALGDILLLPRELQRKPRGSRDLDRPVRPLLGAHAPEEEEVTRIVVSDRVGVEVECVRTVCDPRKIWLRTALIHRDRDEVEAVGGIREELVDHPWLSAQRAVNRVNDRRVCRATDRSCQGTGVIVDDVEIVRTLQAGQRMKKVGRGHPDPARRSLREGRDELCRALRISGGKKCDFVPGFDQPVGQKRHDRLDAPVTGRRNGKPGGTQDCDSDRTPPSPRTTISPCSSEACQTLSKARIPESRILPAHSGGGSDRTP